MECIQQDSFNIRDNLESNCHKLSVKSFLLNENGGVYAGVGRQIWL